MHFTVLVIGDNPSDQIWSFHDDDDGENPNGIFDWCTLGGRWRGFFKLKTGLPDNTVGLLGNPGLHNNKPMYDVDSALKKHIDFDYMYLDKKIKAEKRYDDFLSKYQDNPGMSAVDAYFDYDVQLIPIKDGFVPESKENYVKRKSFITVYAVVKDYKWHEQPSAAPSNIKAIEEYDAELRKLIDSLPDDTLLSLFDCHM